MSSIPAELAHAPVFAKVPRAALDACAPLWTRRRLTPGEGFCRQGDAGDSIALIVEGSCAVEVGGVVINTVGIGELIGDVSAFFPGELRSATLVAAVPTTLLILPATHLARLRALGSPVYDTLLTAALGEVGRRVARANNKLARLVEGSQERPQRKELSAVARLWRALVPGRPARPCPPLEPLLRGLPRLRLADDAALAPLVAAFEPRSFEEGEILVLEQDPADSAWLLAEGQVDVLRQVRGTRAERLARLERGALFGVNALVVGGNRTASCVAVSPGWAWGIRAEASAALTGPAALWWRESMLSSMQAQLRCASDTLLHAMIVPRGDGPTKPGRPAPTEDDRLKDLLRQAGFLESLPRGIDLASVEVVVDEDRRRNPVRKPSLKR